jgi:PAS domain S-box-containing protein
MESSRTIGKRRTADGGQVNEDRRLDREGRLLMLRSIAIFDRRKALHLFSQYGIVIASVGGAFAVTFLLQQFAIRDHFASIFLTAIMISIWFAGAGPGILAILFSLLALESLLYTSGARSGQVGPDLSTFCIFLLNGILVHLASRSFRRRLDDRTAELTRVNAEYRSILEGVPVGIALFEADRIVRRCNPAYENMLGFKPGEIIGRVAPIPEREKGIWETQEKQLRAGGRLADYETTRVRKDGSEFSATITATPIFDSDGNYDGLVGMIIDNTERHARESERQMLTALAQHSPDFVAVANMDGSVVFVNHGGRKLFGLENGDQMRGDSIFEYFAEESTIDKERLFPTIVQQGQFECETLGRNIQSGARFPLHCRFYVIPDVKTGQPAMVSVVARDISERKRDEAKLQMFCSVVKNSPDFIAVADMNLNVTFVNPAGQRIFGLEGDHQVTRTHTLDYFPEAHRKVVRDELIPLLLEQGELTREVPGRNFKTNKSFPALWTAFVIRDQKTNQPALLAAVTKDITKQLEDRDALQRSLKENETLLAENKILQEKLRRENVSLQEINLALQGELAAIQRMKFERIIGGAPALRRTLNKVEQVAATDATVLITGETGTGKELIAQAIHENSKRADMPFRSVNCAALPSTLMAAELFGHEKGAFTGADQQRVGQFELAAGGTLFLDEIGEIPIDMQATLLRVLGEGTFERLGGAKPISADVRPASLFHSKPSGDSRPSCSRYTSLPIPM